MKVSYEFPVEIGQILWMHNYSRHCIDKVIVKSVSMHKGGAIYIALDNEYGDLMRGKWNDDLGKSLFLTEEEAVCAFLANGGENK